MNTLAPLWLLNSYQSYIDVYKMLSLLLSSFHNILNSDSITIGPRRKNIVATNCIAKVRRVQQLGLKNKYFD